MSEYPIKFFEHLSIIDLIVLRKECKQFSARLPEDKEFTKALDEEIGRRYKQQCNQELQRKGE